MLTDGTESKLKDEVDLYRVCVPDSPREWFSIIPEKKFWSKFVPENNFFKERNSIGLNFVSNFGVPEIPFFCWIIFTSEIDRQRERVSPEKCFEHTRRRWIRGGNEVWLAKEKGGARMAGQKCCDSLRQKKKKNVDTMAKTIHNIFFTWWWCNDPTSDFCTEPEKNQI